MAYQDYINCSREALLEKMAELLPEKRLTHCLGVERAAIELAQRFGVDVEKAGLAGLLHDYARSCPKRPSARRRRCCRSARGPRHHAAERACR